MRRFFSVVLFVLGGWMLMGQTLAAFLDVEPGLLDNLLMIASFAILVSPPLLIGAWVSPGEGQRELGLKMLISVGFAIFGALSFLLMLVDPTTSAVMPPMPDIRFAPVIGAANLMLLTAIGWWLYRQKSTACPRDG